MTKKTLKELAEDIISSIEKEDREEFIDSIEKHGAGKIKTTVKNLKKYWNMEEIL